MVAVVPALNSTSKSTGLGIAAQMVSDEIRYCRSLAAGLNRPVELCFFRAAGSASPWFESFRCRTREQDDSYRWVTQLRHMPDSIAISANVALSNVLGSQTPLSQTNGLEMVALRFYPSGEMTLADENVTLAESARFLTLAGKTDLERSPATRPPNFATIQINPRNSQAVVHRP
jgi:hypothetical protein